MQTTNEETQPVRQDAIVSLFCHRLKVGCCIILNDVEQPCARLLAVVTHIAGSRINAKYLNAEAVFDSHNKASGCVTTKALATPVGWFGVIVRIDADGLYWCEQKHASDAKYPDGAHRMFWTLQQRKPLTYGNVRPRRRERLSSAARHGCVVGLYDIVPGLFVGGVRGKKNETWTTAIVGLQNCRTH